MYLVSASSVDSGPNQIAIVRCACQLPLFDLCVTFDLHVNCLCPAARQILVER